MDYNEYLPKKVDSLEEIRKRLFGDPLTINRRIDPATGNTLMGSGATQYEILKPRAGTGFQPDSAYSEGSRWEREGSEKPGHLSRYLPEGLIASGIRAKVDQNPGKLDWDEGDLNAADRLLGITPQDFKNRVLDQRRQELQTEYGNTLKGLALPSVQHGWSEKDVENMILRRNLDKDAIRADKLEFNKQVNLAQQNLSEIISRQNQSALAQRAQDIERYDRLKNDILNRAYQEERDELAQQNLIAERNERIRLIEEQNRQSREQYEENMAFKRDKFDEDNRRYNEGITGNRVNAGLNALMSLFGGIFA